MRKRFVGQLLLTLVLCSLPNVISAYSFMEDGIYYKILSSTDVAVTHKGSSGSVENNSYSGKIIIPSTVTHKQNGENTTYNVTSIDEYAFYKCDVTEVILPNSITQIDWGAFEDCLRLSSINLPESLLSLGDEAFAGCSSLTAITLPSNLRTIREMVFAGCENLTYITIKFQNTLSYCGNAFYDCNNIKEVTVLGNNVPEGIFVQCSSLEKVTFGDAVTTIGNSAFYECTGLKSIEFPESLKYIGDYSFQGCTGLTCIDIPENVEYIGNGAFYECTSLKSISIPDGAYVGAQAFSKCGSVTFSIILPIDVNSIPDYAFQNSGITSITIPNSVTTIGKRSFENCTKLRAITIPQYVTSIGEYAFWGSGIQEVTLFPSVVGNWFNNNTSLRKVILGESVREISDYAFSNCWELSVVSISSGVTTIGNYAFESCNIATINIPESVVRIGNFAFSDNPLSAVSIPSGVTSIGKSAFEYCSVLNSVVLPESLLSIGEYAFRGCNLNTITIPENVSSIGRGTFYQNPLASVIIPANVTSLGSGAFQNCDQLTSVTVGMSTPLSIDENTFTNRKNAVLYVPKGSKADYLAADYWKDFKEIVDDPDGTDISQLDNAIYVDPQEVTIARRFKLPIMLKNNVNVSGLSFTLFLPEGMSLSKDENGDIIYSLNEERAVSNKFSVYWAEYGDGSYGLRILPLSTAGIIGTEGAVVTLTVSASNKMEAGNQIVVLRQNSLSVIDAEGQASTLDLDNTRTMFSTVEGIFSEGDVNGDGRVDLTDAIMIVYSSLGVTSEEFIDNSADVNNDGRIDLTDAIIVVYKSLGIEMKQVPKIREVEPE